MKTLLTILSLGVLAISSTAQVSGETERTIIATATSEEEGKKAVVSEEPEMIRIDWANRITEEKMISDLTDLSTGAINKAEILGNRLQLIKSRIDFIDNALTSGEVNKTQSKEFIRIKDELLVKKEDVELLLN